MVPRIQQIEQLLGSISGGFPEKKTSNIVKKSKSRQNNTD
jgi:hypothetical protein